MRKALRTVVIAFVAIGLVLARRGVARAHEKGAIHLASTAVPVGGDLVMTGVKLPKSGVLRLQLRGTLDNYDVGQVRTDTAGAFQTRLTLPPHVPTGAYTLVAIAADGDVSARTALAVTAGPAAASSSSASMPSTKMPDGTPMPHMSATMSTTHATAEMMEIKRATSAGEWVVIAGAILASLAGGLALLRRASRLIAADGNTVA
ncbi:MAG: TIGR02186 family protein [Gemmatimonadota bacterium]|nr:TIGR02186 family protein [Gemmatimonadota bacterium]